MITRSTSTNITECEPCGRTWPRCKDYATWQGLYTDDGVYVIPIDRDAEEFDGVLNMVYDDQRMRRLRVNRMTEGYAEVLVDADAEQHAQWRPMGTPVSWRDQRKPGTVGGLPSSTAPAASYIEGIRNACSAGTCESWRMRCSGWELSMVDVPGKTPARSSARTWPSRATGGS